MAISVAVQIALTPTGYGLISVFVAVAIIVLIGLWVADVPRRPPRAPAMDRRRAEDLGSVCDQIRATYPLLADMTDEELVHACVKLSDDVNGASLTADEIVRGMQRFASAGMTLTDATTRLIEAEDAARGHALTRRS